MTAEDIFRKVADYYGITYAQILSDSAIIDHLEPRKRAVYLCCQNGLTRQYVAAVLGVDAETVRIWHDDIAAIAHVIQPYLAAIMRAQKNPAD